MINRSIGGNTRSSSKANKSSATAMPREPNKLDVDERFLTPAIIASYKAAKTDLEKTKVTEALTARALSEPSLRAASVIQKYEGDSLNLNALVDELRSQSNVVKGGELGRMEEMLVSQAHTLDALFANLARRSHTNSDGGYLEAAERYMRLALKAQAQAVRTIEALGELKNPRSVAFVRQANIANGPQQVNNGSASQAGENEIQPNKLSGASYELCQNTGASSIEGATYPAMAAVGALDRTDVG